MILKLTRLMGALAAVAITGGLLAGGALRADEPDQDNKRPPQTLPQGFESTDRLQRDLEKAENAPLYSALARRKQPVRESSLRRIHAGPGVYPR